jgi:hypothetical protein
MKLDRLPPRITGFFDRSEAPHSVDGADFKRACHQAAQLEGGIVESVDLDLLGRSYRGATIKTGSDHVSVVCNSVHPYVAFVAPNSFGVGFPELAFVEPTSLAATFANVTGFQPLDAAWLEAELKPELVSD